ncbi:DUF481 domain-containing protein [Mesonia aquimarina]|uniref:DUF481 domain-containing protein n=1 Tax=Mesonia aquimarina TaxID=1504967 RepID=UPI000EF59C86|nr:DUF481 domain-containing protein [Mesonia aquimarina]
MISKILFKLKLCVAFVCFLSFHSIQAQNDSLVLTNNNVIVGELKTMNRGVATMETDYSDDDFKIEWDKIKTIYTTSSFLINLKSGGRYNGKVESSGEKTVNIIRATDTIRDVQKDNIVFLNAVKSSFWDKLSVSLGLGYNYTKANNLSQFSIRSTLGYQERRWALNGSYNDIRSIQDSVADIHRLDAALGFKYYLKKNWFTLAEVSWLSNTEQNIDLRTLGKLGMGKFLVRTNQVYWGVQAGASFNNETFGVNGQKTYNNSGEGFVGTELNLYDIGDLSLLTNLYIYPSFTESGRWRADYRFDFKYDLPLDFYIDLGFSLNYDNKPAESGSESDFVFQTIFGWDL